MKRIYILCLAVSFTLGALLLVGRVGHADGMAAIATFTKNVAPILYKSCAECHRPTGVAPMSLIDYKEVRPWAKSIKERVVDRSMPPWFADSKHGEFSNNPSLSDDEINTIVTWVDRGAPKGEYELKKPLFLPKGARLDCVAHFDNSTRNKFNPDPTKAVRWGDQTWEEMMIGWYTTVNQVRPAARPITADNQQKQ